MHTRGTRAGLGAAKAAATLTPPRNLTADPRPAHRTTPAQSLATYPDTYPPTNPQPHSPTRAGGRDTQKTASACTEYATHTRRRSHEIVISVLFGTSGHDPQLYSDRAHSDDPTRGKDSSQRHVGFCKKSESSVTPV